MKKQLLALSLSSILFGCSDYEEQIDGNYTVYNKYESLTPEQMANCEAVEVGKGTGFGRDFSLLEITKYDDMDDDYSGPQRYQLYFSKNWQMVKMDFVTDPIELDKETNSFTGVITGSDDDRQYQFNYELEYAVQMGVNDFANKVTKLAIKVDYPEKPKKNVTIDFLNGYDDLCLYNITAMVNSVK